MRSLLALAGRLSEDVLDIKFHWWRHRVLLLVVYNRLHRLRFGALLHRLLCLKLLPRIAQETDELLVGIVNELVERLHLSLYEAVEIVVYNLCLSPHTTRCT